ncbi:MAG: hypothetical protein PVJ63_07935 [Thioalkalispiraceae bacterium]|jgi:hypothetical protein
MSDCYSNSCAAGNLNKKHQCPVNGKEYREVSEKTIMHHINEPWDWKGKKQSYFFCDDPDCNVVYFGKDNSIIEKSALRTSVGIKEKTGDALVCYCFGVTVDKAATQPGARNFVIEKTRENMCACEARNPSGKCCLKDFPKP